MFLTAGKMILGVFIVLLGVLLLVLPGPGILTIALGLMVLGIIKRSQVDEWVDVAKKKTKQFFRRYK